MHLTHHPEARGREDLPPPSAGAIEVGVERLLETKVVATEEERVRLARELQAATDKLKRLQVAENRLATADARLEAAESEVEAMTARTLFLKVPIMELLLV